MSQFVSTRILLTGVALATAAGMPFILGAAGASFGTIADAAIGLGTGALIALVAQLIERAQMGRLAGELTESDGPGRALTGLPASLRPLVEAVEQKLVASREREQTLTIEGRERDVRMRVIEAERDRNAAVLDSLRDAVIVTDAFDEIVLTNSTAVRALGFEGEAFQHRPISSLIEDDVLPRTIAEVRESGPSVPVRRIEHEFVRRDGSSVLYESLFKTIGNHRGESAWVVSVMHDLSQERELSQMKTDFVAKASHELRTPLSCIRAYVEMLVDGEANDEDSRLEFYGIIQNETERLGRLIDNMLNISRIEAGIVQIDRVDVDVRSILQRAVETIDPQAQEKRIVVQNKSTDVDLSVEGDPDMLYQVVLNLVSNAVKYTPEGGRITISSDSDNLTRSVVVSVSDTGLGIPPDDLERVFDKFFRVDNYKRVAKGTGLGLSLCKHIVETVHRGQIGVESTLGMGSKFWFSIPMRYVGARSAA